MSMNILISCPGMMFQTVEILRKEFALAGYGTIATGNSDQIAGLYAADKAFIVPAVDDVHYIPRLLDICIENNVKAVLTFLDRDILVISQAAHDFREKGIFPMVVDFEKASICDDKYVMYEYMQNHGFKCAWTVDALEDFQTALDRSEVKFPVFIKPKIGDGSRGTMRCRNMDEVRLGASNNRNFIIQEFLDGPEYDVDLYIDTISQKMVSAFAKRKLVKMVGGTATAISIHDEQIFHLVESLSQSLGLVGVLNMELFAIDGDYYIGEINPRFGASYIGAYACGINFAPLIINNIRGNENRPCLGEYSDGVCMMKYARVLKTPIYLDPS